MKDLNKKVIFQGEDGEKFEMTILKEFDFKDKKYAVLMEEDDHDHDHDCNCDKNIGILEIVKDKDGSDTFVQIEDDKLFEEIVDQAEIAIYEGAE